MIGRFLQWLGLRPRMAPLVVDEDKHFTPDEILEMEGRKQRSIARLEAEHVPYLPQLPWIEPASRINLRSKDEAARRAFCLFAVAAHALGWEADALQGLKDYGVEADLTPAERAYLARPTQDGRMHMSWAIEACMPLLWYLDYYPDLPRPDAQVKAARMIDMVQSLGPRGFLQAAGQRDVAEVLDEADLIYRYHWATRDAELAHRPAPSGLDPDVVLERHRALNWLIGYDDRADWDDVPADT